MNLADRARMRPVLYPVGILAGFVLFLLVKWGVSPYSAGRSLIAALAIGLALPWLFGLLAGDRDRAGILSLLVVMLLLAGQSALAVALLAGVFVVLLAEGWTGRGRQGRIRWPAITRAMSAVTAILLVAIGILAIQNGSVTRIPHDLLAEARVGRPALVAAGTPETTPSVYLILLDGYPRADKLASEFGIDNEPFTRALRDRGFAVADHSRSNHVSTDLTLATMFGGVTPGVPDASPVAIRSFINDGKVIGAFRDRGYEVVAYSSGSEIVALRQADRFIDSGQLNEFEWELLQLSGLAPALDLVAPTLLADQHRSRVLATLDGVASLAGERQDRPRFVVAHVLNPHSPQIFEATGAPIEVRGLQVPFDDSDEWTILGAAEYSRRLAGQIAYLNERIAGLVDAVIAADPGAVVVVFSDHGSGIREAAYFGEISDPDLRTANLLAVRSPGQTGIIDDRSTLVNVLPRILRAYTGSGPADVPEVIHGQPVDGRYPVFERPD